MIGKSPCVVTFLASLNLDKIVKAMKAFWHVARWILHPGNDSSDKIGSRIDKIDAENFDRITKMCPHFPELIVSFKEEPDADDSFIAMV